MMTPPRPAGVLTDLDAVIAEAREDSTGALWRLTGAGRALDSNLVRLRPGAAIEEHTEPLLDVLLVVVTGGGRLDTPDGPHALRPHSACWLPRGTRRALTAGPEGLAYLTVHTRRPGLGIAPAAPAEGGEPACLLNRVCPACGRLTTEPAAAYCSRCGTELPG
ncbi:hypothetical protein BX286_0564 [Streptomyces sp. 3211.6]|uniref:hypothetical protein n=1 Tax=Streptomyces TaxID=1883 RepID=UPI0009A4F63D|nr:MULTISPECIES: hypothetical protein [Streptomyces]RKT02655.1 hypothetical protein BX286_0564 [Streptomyces sp. 3211.6]RPF43980.1 hypothetical protein EDD96_0497 [Streptomyces sp. Ag109_G2-6]